MGALLKKSVKRKIRYHVQRLPASRGSSTPGIRHLVFRHPAPGTRHLVFWKNRKQNSKNIFLKPRENPEKVRENPGKLEEKSKYIFGKVGKVFDGASFAEFSDVFEK